MHKTLKRQLRKATLADGQVDLESLKSLVNKAYDEADKNRRLVDATSRTLEEEVMQLNAALKVEMEKVVTTKNRMEEILNVIKQGIFTFDGSFSIDVGASPHLCEIFNKNMDEIVGQDVFDLIFSNSNICMDAASQVKEFLSICFQESDLSWEANSHILPRELIVRIEGQKKTLHFDWQAMYDAKGRVFRYLLAIRDLTKERELEARLNQEREKHRESMDLILHIITLNPSRLQAFFNSTKKRIDEIFSIANTVSDRKDDIYIALHTIKGNARVLGFSQIAKSAHEAEAILENINSLEHPSQVLQKKMEELRQTMTHHNDLFRNIYAKNEVDQNLNLYDIISQCVRNAQTELEKHGLTIKEFKCQDNVIYWNNKELDQIKQIIEHGITNSIDHGYVRPHQDNDFRTPIEINVSAAVDHENVLLTISDKGVGIDLKDKQQTFGEQDLQDILFTSGFSTAKDVTETSGRGVGLNAIQEAAVSLGGSVALETGEKGVGTDLVVKIPKENVMMESIPNAI